MTVCIAATCDLISRLVLVSDSKMSGPNDSSYGARKMALINEAGPWMAMCAAEDLSLFITLVDDIKAVLGDGDKSVEQVERACENGYSRLLSRRVRQEILFPYGMTRTQFFAAGQAKFGSAFHTIRKAIEKLAKDLGISLLVTGFDVQGRMHLIEVFANGVTRRVDQCSYHAIGSGDFLALSVLRRMSWFALDTDLGPILYRILSAKFAAESAEGVGDKFTAAVVVARGHDAMHSWVPAEIVEEARKHWEEQISAPPPQRMTRAISQWSAAVASGRPWLGIRLPSP